MVGVRVHRRYCRRATHLRPKRRTVCRCADDKLRQSAHSIYHCIENSTSMTVGARTVRFISPREGFYYDIQRCTIPHTSALERLGWDEWDRRTSEKDLSTGRHIRRHTGTCVCVCSWVGGCVWGRAHEWQQQNTYSKMAQLLCDV